MVKCRYIRSTSPSSGTEVSSLSQSAPQPFDLDRFFDYAVDMLCIADVAGYFRRVNHSFERVLGYTQEELLSRPFVEFVHPDDLDDYLGHHRAALDEAASDEETLDFRIVSKTGETRWITHVCRSVHGADGTYLGQRGVKPGDRLLIQVAAASGGATPGAPASNAPAGIGVQPGTPETGGGNQQGP